MYSYGPPTYGRAKAGRPARTYIQQLCEDTGCSPERPARGDERLGKVAREGSGISVLAARHDIYIYIYIYMVFNNFYLILIISSNYIVLKKAFTKKRA